MRISTIQSQHVLYDVRNPGEHTVDYLLTRRDEVVEQALALTEEAAKQGSDLIVTTESINAATFGGDDRYDFLKTGEPMDGPIMKKFAAIAENYKTYIVAGLYTSREGRMYNSAVLFNPKGDIQGVYDKTHLTDGEKPALTPGSSYPVFQTEFGNIAMLICFDLQYPEAVREVALAGADLIACPTWGWENIYGLCRAYESSIHIAAANALPPHGKMWDWCNPSCIVDNMGRIVAVGPTDRTGIVTADLDIRQEPGMQYGNDDSKSSMRYIRTALRRPETYKLIHAIDPPLLDRYKGTTG